MCTDLGGLWDTHVNSQVSLPYVTRLMDLEITDAGIHDVLKKIGIDSDIKPITKIVLENDRKLKKTFLRIR